MVLLIEALTAAIVSFAADRVVELGASTLLGDERVRELVDAVEAAASELGRAYPQARAVNVDDDFFRAPESANDLWDFAFGSPRTARESGRRLAARFKKRYDAAELGVPADILLRDFRGRVRSHVWRRAPLVWKLVHHEGAQPSILTEKFGAYLHSLEAQLTATINARLPGTEIVALDLEDLSHLLSTRATPTIDAGPDIGFLVSNETAPPVQSWPPANLMEALVECGPRVLLVGEAGAGKTLALLELARDLVWRRRDDPSAPLVVHAHLANWGPSRDLIGWLSESSRLARAELRVRLAAGDVTLLLDGLDLVPFSEPSGGIGPAEQLIGELRQLPRAQVVVSCRADAARILITQIPDLPFDGIVGLRPLRADQVRSYFSPFPSMSEVLESDTRMGRLVQSPLMAALLADGFLHGASAATLLPGSHETRRPMTRDDLIERWIATRYAWEANRPASHVSFSLAQIYSTLGEALLRSLELRDAIGGRRAPNVDLVQLHKLLGDSALDFLALLESLQVVESCADPLFRDVQFDFRHDLFLEHFATRFAITQLETTRRPTALKLLAIGCDAATTDLLIKVLSDDAETGAARIASAQALATAGRVDAIPALRRCVKAAFSGSPEDPGNLLPTVAFLAMLGLKPSNLVKTCSDALANAAAFEFLHAVAASNLAVRATKDPKAQSALIRFIRAGNVWAISQADQDAAEIPAVRREIVRWVSAGTPYVRLHAVQALGGTADSDAITALTDGLRDSDERVARAAQTALLSCGPPAVPSLTSALAEFGVMKVPVAVGILARLATPDALNVLVKLYEAGADELERLGLLAAVATSNSSGLKYVVAQLQQPDRARAREASKVLAFLSTEAANGVEAADAVLDLGDKTDPHGLREALLRSMSEAAVEPLLARLRSDDLTRVRCALHYVAFPEIADPRFLMPLWELQLGSTRAELAESAKETMLAVAFVLAQSVHHGGVPAVVAAGALQSKPGALVDMGFAMEASGQTEAQILVGALRHDDTSVLASHLLALLGSSAKGELTRLINAADDASLAMVAPACGLWLRTRPSDSREIRELILQRGEEFTSRVAAAIAKWSVDNSTTRWVLGGIDAPIDSGEPAQSRSLEARLLDALRTGSAPERVLAARLAGVRKLATAGDDLVRAIVDTSGSDELAIQAAVSLAMIGDLSMAQRLSDALQEIGAEGDAARDSRSVRVLAIVHALRRLSRISAGLVKRRETPQHSQASIFSVGFSLNEPDPEFEVRLRGA